MYTQFPEAALRSALYSRLNSQLPPLYAALTSAVTLQITDTPQRDMVPPFVQLGDTLSSYLHTYGEQSSLWDCETTIHVWTGPDRRLNAVTKGRLANDTLRAQVLQALTDTTLGNITLSNGWQICTIAHPLMSRCFLDVNGTDYHGILTFKSVVQSSIVL